VFAVVRPLALFRVLFWPAIVSLNGLGNLLLRFFGLRPGATEETLHSPEELKLCKRTIDEPIGMVLKKDLLDQILDGQAIDPLAAMRQPIALHETMPIFRVPEEFKSAPVLLATILDEYGVLQGIVTQTD
jgi:CBS domain containing-hemolysin-like protein